MTELWRLGATEIAHGISTGRFTSEAATRSALDRIAAVNPRLNAIIDVQADSALSAAHQADTAVQQGRLAGPLHGVPVTVKMNVDQSGHARSHGISELRDRIVDEDGSVVANLRAAGAVILGRTNAPAFAARHSTSNELHGVTVNPWDSLLGVGGSSGGAAAALASGMGALAHGNDLGGSIRQPALCCGLVGLRPTPGRIPGISPSDRIAPTFHLEANAEGLLARSIADARLGLAALGRRDRRDPRWVPEEDCSAILRSGMRIGIATIADDLSDCVRDALEQVSHWLADAGFEIVPLELPDFWEGWDLQRAIMQAERQEGLFADIERYGDQFIRNSMRGRAALNFEPLEGRSSYIQALARREQMMRDWNALLIDYPVVVAPVSLQHPFPAEYDQQGTDAVGELVRANAPLHVTAMLALPGLAVPTGRVGSAPVGIQLISARLREALLFDVGAVIEKRADVTTLWDCP